MTAKIQRRCFIKSASGLAVGTVLAVYSLDKCSAAPQVTSGPAVKLVPASTDLFRVRMEISLEGNVDLPKDPIVSKVRERRLPLKGTSVIDYEERLTRDDKKAAVAARRYYYTATSDATVGGTIEKNELRKEARRIVARQDGGPAVLFGEKEYLTHAELELLQEPISSLGIDGLLPADAVRVGDKWDVPLDSLSRVLNLDFVRNAHVLGEVTQIDAASVKMLVTGRVEASQFGVSTVIDIAGKMTFDRKSESVTWFAVAMREVRDIGLSKPGFEVGAVIKFLRQRLDTANAVRDTAPVDIANPIPLEKLLVNFDSEAGLFSAYLGREWQTLSSSKGLTTLRMIVDEKALAQCDIRELSKMKAGEQLTLEAFQGEVKRSLGDRVQQLFEAEEGLNENGLRTMRVVAAGIVQDVPVQWVFLHFSDDSGRRLAATFTLESSNVEAFGGADAQLANSLIFKKPAKVEQAAIPKSVLER